MKGDIAPRLLAVPLLVALLAAPAIVQEGLVSFWASWGLPLLAAAAVFAVLMAVVLGPLAVRRRLSRRSEPDPEEESEEPEPEPEEDEPAVVDGDVEDAEEASEADQEPTIEPDTALADALSELQPDNFMDLARALQEMGRDADALEVLARVIEGKQGESGEEVAQALRRLGYKLKQDHSTSE